MKFLLSFLLLITVACAQVTIHPADIKPVPAGTVIGSSGGAGVATATPSVTSLNHITFIPPATNATVTFVDGKIFVFSNSMTLAGNDGAILNIVNGGTLGGSAFEGAIGNPSVDGYVLSSTIAGVRSWVASGAGTGVTSLTGTAGEIAVSAATGAVTVSLPGSLVFTGKGITGGTFDGANIGTTTAGPGRFTSILSTTGSIINNASSPITLTQGALNSGVSTFDARNEVNADLLMGVYGSTAAGTLFGVNKAGAAFVNTYASGGTHPSALLIGTGNNTPVVFGVNDIEVGRLTSTGLNGVVIGATTPAAATVTTLASNSNANIRTTKSNFHQIINVKDYGALGDGTTADQAAIAAAFAAVTDHAVVFFPPGKYRLTAVIGDQSGKSFLTVTGEGAEIYNDTGASGLNTLVFDETCSNIEVCGLRFTGTASVRANGIHIRMAANNSTIHDNWFSGCSDFSVLVSQGTGTGWVDQVSVTHNHFGASLGDGVHVGAAINTIVDGNNFQGTGDDSIAVIADDASHKPVRTSVTNNLVYNAGTGGSGCGLRIAEATDLTVENNSFTVTTEAAIFIGRYTSTTTYNNRLLIADNKIMTSTNGGAGMLAGITIQFADTCVVRGNTVEGTVNGGGISFLDCNNLVIQENNIRICPTRGIGSDDTTTTNVAANATGVVITDNVVSGSTLESYYVVAPTGKTISDLMITGNKAISTPAGDYIFTNNLAGIAKIVLNTALESGRTITNGGTGIVPVDTPNY